MPHIHCYLDKPSIVWTMFTSDLLIGIAYFGISLTLWALVRRMKIQFTTVVLCFGVFIGACGGTHLMEDWTLWHPDYWAEAGIKVITAIASVGTAIYLFQLRHPILAVAEAAKLSEQRRLDLETLTESLEKRITEHSETLQLALNATNLGTWKYDPTTTRVVWDRRAEEIFGIDPGSFGGTYAEFEACLHPDDRLSVSRAIQETALKRMDYVQEYRAVLPDGTVRWIASRARTAYDVNGRPLHMIGTVLDVTDRKNQEFDLREAVRARDEFLSIASHELKTPLTTLRLKNQMRQRAISRGPQRDLPPEKFMSFFDTHGDARQLDRLMRLIDDMLDISRISTGKLTIQPELFDLCELTREIISRDEAQFRETGTELQMKTCDSFVGTWDRIRIEQVIINLLTNAAKYGAGKPIEVNVTALSNDKVRLSVRDQGIGIAKENLERIFDRFERAVSANSVSGLGLGLYITRQIVEMHGGRVWAESELGMGSVFTVELPTNSTERAGD